MTATSSASATGCRLISNSISSVAAKKQPESVFACVCVCVKERKRFWRQNWREKETLTTVGRWLSP